MGNRISVFNEATEWNGSGEFTASMTDFTDFAAWLNMASVEFENVVRRYESSVDDDGRIDMLEKGLIIKELDEFLNCLIAFRFHLMEIADSCTVLDPKWGFQYTLNKELNGWSGHGSFQKKYRAKFERFAQWKERVLATKFRKLSETYRKTTADGFIDESEKKELLAILDRFVFEILVVRHLLYKGDWTD